MQASGGFRLIVRRGPQPNQVYELTKEVITLGRDITNDIVINDPEVSRHHARLTRTPGGYTVEDLGSTNGTFVNGQRLSVARPLNNGDMVGMGETVTMAYEGASMPSPEPAPPPGGEVPQPRGGAPSMGMPPQQQQPQSYQQQPYQQQPQPYQQQPYQQQPYGGQQDYMGAQYGQPDYQAAPYYATEQPSEPGALRYVLLACGFLVVLCVVMAVVAVVLIDANDLWCDIPLGPQVVDLVGGDCPECGNNICEIDLGEDAAECPADCATTVP